MKRVEPTPTNPTPGPWQATFSHGPEAEQFNTPRSVYAGHVPIAQIAGQAPGGPSEWAANARLIAAAPDLLAACKLYVSRAKECGAAVNRDAWRAINAAIAKAEGDER